MEPAVLRADRLPRMPEDAWVQRADGPTPNPNALETPAPPGADGGPPPANSPECIKPGSVGGAPDPPGAPSVEAPDAVVAGVTLPLAWSAFPPGPSTCGPLRTDGTGASETPVRYSRAPEPARPTPPTYGPTPLEPPTEPVPVPLAAVPEWPLADPLAELLGNPTPGPEVPWPEADPPPTPPEPPAPDPPVPAELPDKPPPAPGIP